MTALYNVGWVKRSATQRCPARRGFLGRGCALTQPTLVLCLALATGAIADTLAKEAAALAPPMLSRAEWNAAAPRPGMQPQVPAEIVLHNTGIAQNPSRSLVEKMRNLQSFSQRAERISPATIKPAWPDIPYHYYIDLTGRIAEARDPRFAGDSNTSYDLANRLQVVLEGNFDKEHPAPEQLAALADLLAWLQLSWNIPDAGISVHKDHATTSCPGANFVPEVAAVLAAAIERRRELIAAHCPQSPGPLFAQAYCK